jgi:Domain of unknown function (DUF4417)
MDTRGRLEYLDPAQLSDNPRNWKFHPPEQLDVIRSSLERLGHLKPLGTYNATTGRLLDGHARKGILEAAGSGPVPIWVVELPEELEAEALATLDPSGWTAVPDKSKLLALLASGPKIEHEGTAKLLELVKQSAKLLEPDVREPEREEEAIEVSLALDAIWPTDNPYAVPLLDHNLQAEQVPGPVYCWGSIGHSRLMQGTYHFYTSDYKFEPLWKKPHRVLFSKCQAVVEPNFSTIAQTPFAVSLWNIYRKRWLARYWQSQGLRVLVDLNVTPALNRPHEGTGGRRPNLLGVPTGWKSYASRAHANQPDTLVDDYEVAREHAGIENPMFLCVGGGKRVQTLASENGWLWIPEQVETSLGSRRGDTSPSPDVAA